jgi:hypothetical protein
MTKENDSSRLRRPPQRAGHIDTLFRAGGFEHVYPSEQAVEDGVLVAGSTRLCS